MKPGSAAYFTLDGIFHEAKKVPVAGRDNIAAHWKPFFHGGPEWRMTVHDLFGDGTNFAVAYTWGNQAQRRHVDRQSRLCNRQNARRQNCRVARI